jgi:hypothetical protein
MWPAQPSANRKHSLSLGVTSPTPEGSTTGSDRSCGTCFSTILSTGFSIIFSTILGRNHQSPAAPPLSQECAPGANCAQSTGQSGGITAGQINIGAQDWKTTMSGPRQIALINALEQTPGKFRLGWLFQDVGGMEFSGFLNYAFIHAKWTPDQPNNYGGAICYPSQEWDCSGLQITVKDRNSKIANTAITAISALVPKVRIIESDKLDNDRVEVMIAKDSK